MQEFVQLCGVDDDGGDRVDDELGWNGTWRTEDGGIVHMPTSPRGRVLVARPSNMPISTYRI